MICSTCTIHAVYAVSAAVANKSVHLVINKVHLATFVARDLKRGAILPP